MTGRIGVVFAACFFLLSCGGEDAEQLSEPVAQGSQTTAASGYDPASARALAIQSMQLPDAAQAISALEQATRMAPSMVDPWLLLAGRRAERGDVDGALSALGHLTRLGIRAPIDGYPPLAPLQADERWAPLVAELDAALSPSGSSKVLFELEQKDLLTEGIAYDPGDSAWYVSAVHGRKIVKVGSDGSVRDFLVGNDVWGVFGLAIDVARRHLWATTAVIAQMQGYDPSLDGRTALIQVDLNSGEVLQRYELPPVESADGPGIRRLGDVAVASDGTVYASDTMSPGGIYRLEPDGRELDHIGENLLLNSPQGLALLDADRLLVIADYSLGLVALDLESEAVWFIEPPHDLWLQTLDGLAVAGPSELVAIQNGGYPPHRILRLTLSEDRHRVDSWTVAAQALPEWAEPTLGTVVKLGSARQFVYVAASQWRLFPEDGPPDLSQLVAPKIMSLDLDPPGDQPVGTP